MWRAIRLSERKSGVVKRLDKRRALSAVRRRDLPGRTVQQQQRVTTVHYSSKARFSSALSTQQQQQQHVVAAPETLAHQSPNTETVKSLFNTLLASQELVPESKITTNNDETATTVPTTTVGSPVDQDIWIRYFSDLGSTVQDDPTSWRSKPANNIDNTGTTALPASAPPLENAPSGRSDPATYYIKATAAPTVTAAAAAASTNEAGATTSSTPSSTGGAPRATRPSQQPDLQKRRMERQLARCIQDKNSQRAMDTFHLGLRYETADELPTDTVRQLFFLVAHKRPFDAYKVLKHYQKMTAADNNNDPNAYADMYERLCDALRFINPQKHYFGDIHKLVRGLVRDLQRLDRAGKEQCYPTLVSALVSQKSVSLGAFARLAYEYIIEHDVRVPAGYWEHLLGMSRYFRQKDLPYADILHRIVKMGRRPDPVTTLNALENLFPYTDVDATFTALRTIVHLQSTADTAKDGNEYLVDISALEVIGAAASKAGHYECSLIIWDLVDLYGYKPTEAIYENTVMVFAAQPGTYGNAFTVLADMETHGYEPSRALIRGFSSHLRNAPGNLDAALEHLKHLRMKGGKISPAALNVILSGGAERGDVDRTVFMLEEFDRSDVVQDADTYSFAFETLGKNIARRTRNPASKEQIDSFLGMADSFLSAMEDRGIAPTHHIIREYVELLCLAGEVETATAVVTETLESKGAVNNKTIYRVAMANVAAENLEVARELAMSASEPLSFLLQSIKEAENRRSALANKLSKSDS